MKKIQVLSPPKDQPIGAGSVSNLPLSRPVSLPFYPTVLSKQSLPFSQTPSRLANKLSKPPSATNPWLEDYLQGEDYGEGDEELDLPLSLMPEIPITMSTKCMPESTSAFSKFARFHCGPRHRNFFQPKVSSGIICGGYEAQLSSDQLNEMLNRVYGVKGDKLTSPQSPLKKSKPRLKRKVKEIKNEHAFKRVWERHDFGVKGTQIRELSEGVRLTETIIDWKKWPPQVPQYPFGVKIPVDFSEKVELNISGRKFNEVNLGIEAQPKAFISREEFESLKGILNIPKATSCTVTPGSIVFNTQAEQKKSYTATLKIHNTGSKSRRICIVRPQSNYFDVIWGAEMNQKPTLPPGLSVRVLITFKPLSNEAINDMLTILINGDGAVVVPLLSVNKSCPTLEMEEFDCGCTSLGMEKKSRFQIRNYGSSARFWFLTEEEFVNEKFSERRYSPLDQCEEPNEIEEEEGEYFEYENYHKQDEVEELFNSKHRSKKKHSKPIEEVLMEDQPYLSTDEMRTSITTKNELDRLVTECFRLTPACFSLQKDQEISLKIRFKPNKTHFYFEKIAMLCDNGEVKWVALKGTGIDIKTTKIIRLESDFTGPPSDLPSDASTQLSLDLGDLLAGEIGKRKLSILNLTSIPFVFFWSIRKIRSPKGSKDSDFVQDALQKYPELSVNFESETVQKEKRIGTTDKVDENGDGDPGISQIEEDENEEDTFFFPINIKPNRGVLNAKEFTDFEVSVTCPSEMGYHGCVISIFLEQYDRPSSLETFIKDMGRIDLDSLSLPIPKPPIIKEPVPPPPIEPIVEPEEDIYTKYLKASSAKDIKHVIPLLPDEKGANKDEIAIPKGSSKRKSKYKNLKPSEEIELWVRTIPMDCYFKPEFLLVAGAATQTITRTIEFYNDTNHRVELLLDDNQNNICSIITERLTCKIGPKESSTIKVIVVFRKSGTYLGELKGKIVLPFAEVDCLIPVQVEVSGVYIDIMTPVINFGLVASKAEKVKTVSIRNTSHQRASWHAKTSKDVLVDQNNNELSIPDYHIKNLNLIHIWPDWGMLNPGETTGFQVYLFAEVTGSLTSAIEITIEENVLCSICVPILAEIQYPCLFLEKSSIPVEIYANTQYCIPSVRLINPSGFLTHFKWAPAMGMHSKVAQIEISPSAGIVIPRSCLTCEISITVQRETIIDNLFIPCFVEGLKEPLILEITGKVFPQIGGQEDLEDDEGYDREAKIIESMTKLRMITSGGDINVHH